LLSPKPTDQDKSSVAAAEQRISLYTWVGAVGIGLAVLVGCSSPTLGTFLFLGGALLVLGLFLLLGRLAVKMPRLGFTSRDADLEHCLKSLEIPSVDLSTDLVLEGDWHWSPAGNAFVAERIDQFLRSDGRFDLNE